MPSLFNDARFSNKYTLSYVLESDDPSGTDSSGNPTFSSTAGSLEAFMAPRKNQQLYRQEGADSDLIYFKGELNDPLAFPTGLRVGSSLTMTFEGRVGVLTVTSIIPNDLPVDFGDYFEAEWRPS